MRLIMLAAALCLSGCATLSIDSSSVPTEGAYQALNAIDMSQTVMTARNPAHFWEHDWPTTALIGRHPSTGGVVAYGALVGAAHYAVTGWLDRQVDATGSSNWATARWVWRLGTLVSPVYNIINNHQIGLRPFGGRTADQPAPALQLRPIG